MTNNQSTHQVPIQISGIAHTRWATHGGITELNTHPHHDTNNKFFVVHNGIIENQYKLKEELKKE